MKFEDLIQAHNKALQRSVDDNTFLNQRIKARMKDAFPFYRRSVRSVSRHPLLLYSFIFLVFTVINLMLVGGFQVSPSSPHLPPENLAAGLQSLNPDFPGSISKAYEEVME